MWRLPPFFPLDNLPSNIIPYVREALEDIEKGIAYSERVEWKTAENER